MCQKITYCLLATFTCYYFISCENRTIVDFRDSNDSQDSIGFYLRKSQDENFTLLERNNMVLKAYRFAEHLEDSVKMIKTIDVAAAFYNLKNSHLHKRFSKKVLDIAIEQKDTTMMARAYVNLAANYRNTYQTDSAYYYYFNAHKAYQTIKDTLNIGATLLNMAIIQSNENDYLGAEASTIHAIPYLTITKDERRLASAYNNLGIISSELDQYENAIRYHKEAYKYRQGLKHEKSEVLQAHSLNNIGVVYQRMQEYDEAISYFQQALNYPNLATEAESFYAMVLDNLTYSKFLSGSNEDLTEEFNKALAIRDSLNDLPGMATNNLHLAYYYNSKEEVSKAKDYAFQAKLLAEKAKDFKTLIETLLLLSKLETKEESIHLMDRYVKISDSMQQSERAMRNQFARIRFDTDQITQEYEKVTRQKEMLIFSIAILFTLGLLVYIIVKQMSQNKELRYQQQQQQANEEIYNLMLSQQVKLEEGRQMEKERISRDLHDGILGNLFGTRLSLESLIMRDDQSTKGEKTRHIMELKKIEQEIRNISHDLSTELFTADIGYVEVVEKLIKTQTAINNLQFEFTNNADIKWERISSKVKIHLYRIVQEALQNINKHAKAKNIKIELLENKNNIHLEITDDGVGFKTEKSKNGIGLKNIESRVNEVSGKLKILSKKDKGTTISIDIPFQ